MSDEGYTCVRADLAPSGEPVWALCDRMGRLTGDVWSDYAPARAEAERRNADIIAARFKEPKA